MSKREIAKYSKTPKEMQSAFKETLTGLSSFCRLVMYEALAYCDYQTGTITLPPLSGFAQTDFQVDAAPGRGKEEINGDTLRNAFRSIKKAKPCHFHFSTVNQRIVIDMPFMRDLYQEFLRGRVEEVTKMSVSKNY